MNQNILISKIVANATETSWAQAYSTLNLYVTISVNASSPQEKSVAQCGRELLEKIQREFFAQDEKTLTSIKQAVTRVMESIENGFSCSVILVSIVQSVAYIVIAHEGDVFLRREGKVGNIAKGEPHQILSFSGILKENDLLILATQGFLEKIPVEKLIPILESKEFLEISEHLSPELHTNVKGNEAAIVIQYKTDAQNEDISVQEAPELVIPEKIHTPKIDIKEPEEEESFSEPLPPEKKSRILSFPHLSIPKNKKLIIPIILLILIGAFAFFIFNEQQNRERKVAQEKLNSILAPAKKEYEEAIALLSVNTALGIENITKIKNSLEENKNKFLEHSPERQAIEELLAKINADLQSSDTSAEAKNQKILLDSKSDIKQFGPITLKGGKLIVMDKSSGDAAILSTSGEITTTISNLIKDAGYVTADETNIYALGDDGVAKANKSTKKVQKIISFTKSSDYAGIDTFLENVYLLNKKISDVEKYASSSYTKSSYFTNENALTSTPVSFSIDASIWIMDSSGKIHKFTKGKEDAFEIKGMTKPFGRNPQMYTDPDIASIYILDPDNARVVSLKKSGEYNTSYDSSSLKKASSFAVDETRKKIYFIVNNSLASFDM